MYVQGKTLHVKPMQQTLADSVTVALHWGDSLREFNPHICTLAQVNEGLARGWDPIQHKAIVGRAGKPSGAPDVAASRDGFDDVAAACLVVAPPIRTQAEADQLAQAAVNQRTERFIVADGVAEGHPAIKAGARLDIANVGRRLSGHYLVTSATHTYNARSNYVTCFSISGGQANDLFSLLQPQAAASPIPASPLVIGIVSDNQDPQNLGRVKVTYPWLSPDHASDWARVVSVGAGKQRGIQFLPCVGDEVLVGFELGDLRFPYVLGGLFNGQDHPPQKNSEAAQNGKVKRNLIRDGAGNLIELHDEGGLTLRDKTGNMLHLDSKSKQVVIEAKGDLALKASGNVSIEAQGQVTIKGTQIKLN